MAGNILDSGNLLNLAQDKSASSRNQLVENISDMFMSADGRLNEHERALMNDVLLKLVSSVEHDIKKELSHRIAESDDVSPELAKFLANESIDIAEPILQQSNVLKDEELIEVIRNRTEGHRMAIAIRSDVSEEVCEELVDMGEEDVIESLIKNDNARISELTMEYLVAESRSVDRFQEPLLNRADLSNDLACRMYWWVSAALRRKIILEMDVDSTFLDDALEMATKTAIQNHGQNHGKLDGVMKMAQNLAREMALSDELSITFLRQCLRQEKINLFVAGLSEMSGLDIKIIWRAIREKSGESMAIIIKSQEADRQSFASLFLLIVHAHSGGKARSTALVNSILSLYDDIEVKNARAAVRYWQRDSGYQDAITDLKEGES